MSTIAMTAGTRASGADRRSAGPVRLTRRGRLVVFLTCLAVLGAALVLAAGTAIGAGTAGEPVPTRVVTVQPGDTLWGIATRAAPGEDPRAVIERIRELNAVGSSLQAGAKLHVPVQP